MQQRRSRSDGHRERYRARCRRACEKRVHGPVLRIEQKQVHRSVSVYIRGYGSTPLAGSHRGNDRPERSVSVAEHDRSGVRDIELAVAVEISGDETRVVTDREALQIRKRAVAVAEPHLKVTVARRIDQVSLAVAVEV